MRQVVPENEIIENVRTLSRMVLNEVKRQKELQAAGRFDYTPSDPIPLGDKFMMLMEELGEASKAGMEQAGTVSDSVDIDSDGKKIEGKGKKGKDMIDELIQLCALALRLAAYEMALRLDEVKKRSNEVYGKFAEPPVRDHDFEANEEGGEPSLCAHCGKPQHFHARS